MAGDLTARNHCRTKNYEQITDVGSAVVFLGAHMSTREQKATCTETQGIVGYHELLVVYTYRCSGRLHRARYRMKESGSVQPPFSIIHVGV